MFLSPYFFTSNKNRRFSNGRAKNEMEQIIVKRVVSRSDFEIIKNRITLINDKRAPIFREIKMNLTRLHQSKIYEQNPM